MHYEKRHIAYKKTVYCPLNVIYISFLSKLCSWRTHFIAYGKDLLNGIESYSHIILLFTNALLLTIFYCVNLSPSFLAKQFRKELLFNGLWLFIANWKTATLVARSIRWKSNNLKSNWRLVYMNVFHCPDIVKFFRLLYS